MKSIPLHLLNSFVIFADSQSMESAARRIGITQPALSKQLKSLEELLQRPLFTQVGKRKLLTPFGESLHLKVKSRLSPLQDDIREVLQAVQEPEQARVRISARREVLDRLATQVKFAGTLVLIESHHQDILHSLRERKTEIGITHDVPSTHELIAKSLFRESFHLVLPKSLFGRTHAPRNWGSDLQTLPVLAYKEEDGILRSACETIAGLSFSNLQIKRVTSNYNSLGHMVAAGLGWAVLPEYFPVSASENWLLPIRTKKLERHEFQALYRRETGEAHWLKPLISQLQNAFRLEEKRRASQSP